VTVVCKLREVRVTSQWVMGANRRAQAYRVLGQYSQAVVDLDKARTLEPRNSAIQYAVRTPLRPPRRAQEALLSLRDNV
jgi:hypothetical protein